MYQLDGCRVTHTGVFGSDNIIGFKIGLKLMEQKLQITPVLWQKPAACITHNAPGAQLVWMYIHITSINTDNLQEFTPARWQLNDVREINRTQSLSSHFRCLHSAWVGTFSCRLPLLFRLQCLISASVQLVSWRFRVQISSCSKGHCGHSSLSCCSPLLPLGFHCRTAHKGHVSQSTNIKYWLMSVTLW